MHLNRLGAWLVSMAAATGATAATAVIPGPAFPVLDSAVAIQAFCTRGLQHAKTRLAAVERHRADAGWLTAYDGLVALIEDQAGPISLLSNVHPDPAVREAAEACELRWQDFSSSLSQSEALFNAARGLRPRDAIDAEFVRRLREEFEDAGVSLPPEQRQRAKAINDRLTALNQEFERHIRDARVQLPFTTDQLRGVPEAVWERAARDDQGRVLLGVDTPTYVAVMQNAADPGTRQRVWRAKTDEGGAANLKLLAEIGQLRKEYASLFGAASYADFVLRRNMAHSAPQAQAFLDQVLKAVKGREQQELDDMRTAKARELNQPVAQTTLQRWDVGYYEEQVRRERYAIDQEAFRKYFPPQQSLAFVMRVIEKMLGVRYVRVPGVKLWHPDAQAYAVHDARTGKPLAALYVDLFPRPGKYNHAAVWSFRNGSFDGRRLPQAALVVNMSANGLTLEEIQTLLHEFGHAVHNNLSATRHAAQGGTSVLRDFVEAPSQMLEDWVYDARVLAVMQEVCPACEPVPAALLAKAQAARKHGKGLWYARQWLYAAFDLAMHGPDAPEPMALWARMEGATPLGHVTGSMFPAGFGHVAGGYGAGYYGYLWSEVLAADMRTAFGSNRLDPAVGQRYRRIVLANGGQVKPEELVRRFLGRESNARAFFNELQ